MSASSTAETSRDWAAATSGPGDGVGQTSSQKATQRLRSRRDQRTYERKALRATVNSQAARSVSSRNPGAARASAIQVS